MAFPRPSQRMAETSNSTEYNKLRKLMIAAKTGKCSFCPWHGIENAWHSGGPQRSWKAYRAAQYHGSPERRR